MNSNRWCSEQQMLRTIWHKQQRSHRKSLRCSAFYPATPDFRCIFCRACEWMTPSCTTAPRSWASARKGSHRLLYEADMLQRYRMNRNQQITMKLPSKITSLVHKISHLNVIVHRQVTNGMSVFPSLVAEFFQDFLKITSVFVEKFRQNRAVFKTRVHSLTIERDHSMTGVTNQQKFRWQVIGSALDCHQILRFCLEEVFDETLFANQRNWVGKVGCKELQKVAGTFDFIEIFERHEQSDGPRKVLVWQSDHHEFTAWPDVKVVVRHFELKLWINYGKFKKIVKDVKVCILTPFVSLGGIKSSK